MKMISALLIVPAAAARGFSATPERMAGSATLIGAVSVLGGLWASLALDTPAGPSIIAVAAGTANMLDKAAIGGLQRGQRPR